MRPRKHCSTGIRQLCDILTYFVRPGALLATDDVPKDMDGLEGVAGSLGRVEDGAFQDPRRRGDGSRRWHLHEEGEGRGEVGSDTLRYEKAEAMLTVGKSHASSRLPDHHHLRRLECPLDDLVSPIWGACVQAREARAGCDWQTMCRYSLARRSRQGHTLPLIFSMVLLPTGMIHFASCHSRRVY